MNLNSAIQKTVSKTGTIQDPRYESAISRTITPISATQRTISESGAINKTGSLAVLTGGGVLGVDVLGAFLLGDPAITTYNIWISKKSVI